MDVYRGANIAQQALAGPVLTLGNFDGVHLGHQALVAEVRRQAAAAGRPAAAMTFDPHPVSVVAPDKAPPLITTIDERIALLEDLGLDALIVQPFDRNFAAQTPEAFTHDVLLEGLRPTSLVVGFNYGFGKGRSGGVEVLEAAGAEAGVGVTVMPAVQADGVRVSSTKVRTRVAAGDLDGAAALLGRTFSLGGPVVEGDRRGRELGFPTANLEVGTRLLPPAGVYATRAHCRGRTHVAATHVGPAPTFDTPPRLEAHLLDFDGELYGEHLTVEFVAHVRDTCSFAGVDELVAQIQVDVEQVRRRVEAGA